MSKYFIYPKPKGIRYFIFCLRWMFKNRDWQSTRQKYKALDKDWFKHETTRYH